MRIRNKKLVPPSPVKVVIHRQDEQGKDASITFLCGAVLDYSAFDRLVPDPKPPLIMNVKTNVNYTDTEDRGYKKQVNRWSELKIQYLMLMSISATPDLEWDTVNVNDPETWCNCKTELKQFLTEAEYSRIVDGVFEANSPTGKRRQEALDVFTPSQVQPSPEVSLTTYPEAEQMTTPSIEPANVSESDHRV